MVFFEKSQPAPACLETEKAKANGDYKTGETLIRIKDDFKNKCYICEYKEPESINVEHFIPHEGDKTLKFDWNNLFWSCGHCNNIKSNDYKEILNCTDKTDNVDSVLKYNLKPFPFEMVDIIPMNSNPKTINTRDLLLAIYNGTTPLKKIESSNLRGKILDEIMCFQQLLVDYFKDTNTPEAKRNYLFKIQGHLNRASNFTAFKRWIVWENERLNKEFGQYID